MSRYMIIALSLLAPLNIHATPIQGGDPRGDDRPLNLGHPEYEHEWRVYEADQIRFAARMEQIQNAMDEIQPAIDDVQLPVVDDVQSIDTSDIQAPDTTIIQTPLEPIQAVSDAPEDGPLSPLHAGIALPAAAFSLVGSLGTVIPAGSTNIGLISDTRGTVIERRFDVNQKSSYVAITTATLTTSYTKALWVRAYDTLGYPHLMGSASGNAAATGPAAHYLYLWGGRLIGGHAVGGKRYQILDSTAIPVNQWVHVAMTYDDSSKRLTMYRNGAQVATAITPAGWTLGASATVGNQDGIYGLNGCIDRAYVYNQALSSTQIAQLYTDETNPATTQQTIPVTQKPTVPVTQAPVPVTQKPTVPVTQAPVPVTQKPTVPVTQAPVPVTQKPTVPVTQAPVPVTQAPVPVTQKPTVPVTQAPVPVTQAPVPPTTTTTYPAGAVIGTSAQKINYRGGQVMVGATKVYILFYGGWAASDPIFTLVPSFVNGLSGSGWWNIQTSYPQTVGGITSRPSNQISWGGYSTERGTEAGSYTTIISDSNIYAMINKHLTAGRLPWDPQGLYLVLTAPDVQIQSGFCTSYCGWHTSASASRVYASTGRVRYGLIGSGIRCPSSCLPNINPSVSPNGDRNADGMMSIIAHELAEMVSDPDLSAWQDSSNYENADKCAWNFGKSLGSLYRTANGANANLKLGGRDWLIQSNWVNFQSGFCGMTY